MQCLGSNTRGERCRIPEQFVGPNGYCAAHDAASAGRMRQLASMGGRALRAKHATPGLRPGELPEVTDFDSAKAALNVLARTCVERRITHAECSAASRAVSEWVRTESARMTAAVVTELRTELARREAEIAELRRQLHGRMAVAR